MMHKSGAETSGPTRALRFSAAAPGLAIYPNPVREVLYLEWAGLGAGCVAQVRSANGQLVLQQALRGAGVQAVDVGGLPAGVYVVEVTAADGRTDRLPVVKQ